MILYQFYIHNRLTPKCYFLQGNYLGDFGRSQSFGGLQQVQRLAARIIWRSGGQVMSVGRFRSKSGTHRALFEQTTFGGKKDCTVALGRSKIAGKHIWVARNRDRTKSNPGHANRGNVGPATASFCKLLQNKFLKVPARPRRRDEQKS